METAIEKAINTGIAVPGALGIILAIGTFAFMAWLVYYIMTVNTKRENKLMDFIQVQLAQQQSALSRIEQAGTYQRDEHKKIIELAEKCIERHDAGAVLLESLISILIGKGFKPTIGGT